MALVNGSIPNMINGVSQQPPHLRLPSQAQGILNGWPSVVEGQRKRPPIEHIDVLTGLSVTDPFIHTINRDITERYILVIDNGTVKVFDINGVEQTVDTTGANMAYFTGANASDIFKAVTVADYTFILNKTRVTAAAAATAATRPYEALVWVRSSSYGVTHSIEIDGTQRASYTVPDGSSSSHTSDVATSNIATELYNDLVAWGGTGFTFQLSGSTIYIKNDTTNFTIDHADGGGDTQMVVLKDTVQRFSDLPEKGFINGFTLEVKGDQSSSFANYYVKFNGDTWEETVQPGLVLGLNASTMPHVLISQGGGNFDLEVVNWEDREVGDDESNPMPSFVGRTISDVFFHRNRLSFMSDENVIMSQAGDFFDFFKDTVTDLLDDDPIDVGTTHTKVSILRHAVPYKQSLVCFSDQTQFILRGDDLLTPTTVSFRPHTEYEINPNCVPAAAGRSVFFAFDRGRFGGVRELFISDDNTEFQDAPEVTGHVPQYLPKNITNMIASSAEDCLITWSRDDKRTLYVYKWFWNGPDKIQSSWNKWTFEEDILAASFIESTLYLLVENSAGAVSLRKIEVQPAEIDQAALTFHLDDQFTTSHADASITYDALTDKTTIIFPFTTDATNMQCYVDSSTGAGLIGQYITGFTQLTGSSGEIDGDQTAKTFIIGKPYTWEYEFSTIYVQSTARNGATQSVLRGTLNLSSMTVSFDDTGYVRVEVTPEGGDTYDYVYAGRVTGEDANIIGTIAINSGEFKFPIMANNQNVTIKMINDSALPSHVMSAEWEGQYVNQARRI